MMKKLWVVTVLLVSMMLITTISASAENIMPRADTEFDSAYPCLLSSKSVTFRCVTYETKQSISVTACWLEVWTSGAWRKVTDLTPPSKVNTNTFTYTATVDYANKIGSGTFRVWATFNADGHEITRCSNERTY